MSVGNEVSGGEPPLTVYRTTWQDSTGAWQPGPDFALGFIWDAEGEIPQPVVHLMGQDVSQYAAITVDQYRRLVVSLDLSEVESIVCDTTPEMYLACTANLSADGESFSGQILRLCSGAVEYGWEGRCELLGATPLPEIERIVEALMALGPATRSTSATPSAQPTRTSDPTSQDSPRWG